MDKNIFAWIMWCVLSVAPLTTFAAAQNESRISHGTLNLVLANRNGAVIATDSRASSGPHCSIHQDDSVKLFKTSDQSALAIAGFASSSLDLPFNMKVAGVIGRHFDPNYNTAPIETSVFLNNWLDTQILPDIEALAALIESIFQLSSGGIPTGYHFDFIATTVDTFAKGVPHISQTRFIQTSRSTLGPLGNSYPSFKVDREETVANHFLYRTAGIAKFADPILEGKVDDPDPAVKSYLAAMRRGRLDYLSVDILVALAHRLLAITARNEPCVGGPDQVAILPVKGKALWTVKDASKLYEQLEGKRYALGISFDANKGDKPSQEVLPDHSERINQWTYAMIDNRIQNSRVWLDGNLFVGNLLTNPIFVWNGRIFQFPMNLNRIEGTCKIEVGPNALDAQIPIEFVACQKSVAAPKPPVEAVGYPIPLVVVPLSEILKEQKAAKKTVDGKH